MKDTEQILTHLLSESGYENVHFGTSEGISETTIKNNADQAKNFLQRRIRQNDIILLVHMVMLLVLFIIFVWFLMSYKDKLDIKLILLGNGVSAGVFGWIILNMKKMWREKTIAELAIYTLSSREVSVEEMLKIIAIFKDSQ